jgi:hypothetical protein
MKSAATMELGSDKKMTFIQLSDYKNKKLTRLVVGEL